MKSLIVIPARYNSTRLPGKPLLDIHGKTMIQRVWEKCVLSDADEVIVATDSQKIYEHVSSYGKAVMTSDTCKTGTERVIEAALKFTEYDVVVNVQGDEPFIEIQDIKDIISSVNSNPNKISTLITALEKEEYLDRNCVKCLCDYKTVSMFTRSPFYEFVKNVYKHVGVYGFSRHVLETISILDTKTINEEAENLEQLRWMDNGIGMIASYTGNKSIGIDTIEDYNNSLKLIK